MPEDEPLGMEAVESTSCRRGPGRGVAEELERVGAGRRAVERPRDDVLPPLLVTSEMTG